MVRRKKPDGRPPKPNHYIIGCRAGHHSVLIADQVTTESIGGYSLALDAGHYPLHGMSSISARELALDAGGYPLAIADQVTTATVAGTHVLTASAGHLPLAIADLVSTDIGGKNYSLSLGAKHFGVLCGESIAARHFPISAGAVPFAIADLVTTGDAAAI